MKRCGLVEMSVLLSDVASDMLHNSFYGAPKTLHSAKDYQLKRAFGGNDEQLSRAVTDAAKKTGVDASMFFVVHLYADSCVLIIPYRFSDELAKRFAEELNVQAESLGLYPCFAKTDTLANSYCFADYWIFSRKILEQSQSLLKNSFFTIN